MRNNIVHRGSHELTYEIRGIVALARQIEQFGVPITWENIGDPVAKGESIPVWMKQIVSELAMQDASYGYCPTEGVLATRQFLTHLRNERGGAQITPDDILFFNGLGDAISRIYMLLRREARVIGPSPAYPTHSSAEGAHAGSHHLTYKLDPENDWLPDLADLERQIQEHPAISGILLINPGNPTGSVIPKRMLQEIVALAKRYDLFLIVDEIYQNLTFGEEAVPLSDVVGDVPALCLAGISKELPWPGARCGWMEVYNRQHDSNFDQFVKTLFQAKMLEVCATTLPQMAIPAILSHAEYQPHVHQRRERYAEAARVAYERFSQVGAITVGKPKGAFFLSVVFKDGCLPVDGSLPIENDALRAFVEEKALSYSAEMRFVLYLLAATGICVVPLSSFATEQRGFRMTLLEQDPQKFRWIVETIATAIEHYSAKSDCRSLAAAS